MDNPYIGIVSFALGLVGATLGIINFWYTFIDRRVRLKVLPKFGYEAGPGIFLMASQASAMPVSTPPPISKWRWCIEVVNMSAFPVTISTVGFGRVKDAHKHTIILPDMRPGQTWPTRLEPRHAANFYTVEGERLPTIVQKYPCAFAETECGTIVYGSSPILKFISKVKTIREASDLLDPPPPAC